MLTASGALSPSLPGNLCLCNDDYILSFSGEGETNNVWLCSGCGIITIPKVGWFDLRVPLRAMLVSVLAPVKQNDHSEIEYYDHRPRLIERHEIPLRLRVTQGAVADTVTFDALVGKDGRVSELRLRRRASTLDSLAAEYVTRDVYSPALSRNRPVAAWITVLVPVPRP